MPVSNKTHKKLQDRLDKTEARHLAEMTTKNKQLEELEAQVTFWRARAEALASSPQIKADTEAAFKRGMAHARNQLKVKFMGILTSDSYPVSEIPQHITFSKPQITIETTEQEQ